MVMRNTKKLKVPLIIFFIIGIIIFNGCSAPTPKNSKNAMSKTDTTANVPIIKNINVYFESSGSMFPYEMGASNDFRQDLNSLFNILNQKKGIQWNFYSVNDNIYPIPGLSLQALVTDNNIYNHFKNLGNYNTTNYQEIFSKVLKKTNSKSLNILITDLIYSTTLKEKISAQDLSRDFGQLSNIIFKKYSNSVSLILFKMSSPFKGKYFGNFYGAEKSQWINHKRPYYILIFGSEPEIFNLVHNEQLKDTGILKEKLKGFENYLVFSKIKPMQNLYYSALPFSVPGIHHFTNAKNNSNGVHELIYDGKHKKGSFLLGVDFSRVPLFPGYFENIRHYEYTDTSVFKVEYLGKIDPDSISTFDKKYIRSISDLFKVTMNDIQAIDFHLQLKSDIPQWVINTNTYDDGRIGKVSNDKTIGFLDFVAGLQQAYQSNSLGNNYFDIKVKIIK